MGMGKYVAVVLVALGVLLGAGWAIDNNARTSVKAEMTIEYQKKLDEAEKKAKEAEDNLEAELQSTRKERNERVKALSATIGNLRNELRNRPYRPTDNSTTPQSGTTCTGAQLYREDAEFLAGEAARAESVRIERDYYYEVYENARKELERLHKEGQK